MDVICLTGTSVDNVKEVRFSNKITRNSLIVKLFHCKQCFAVSMRVHYYVEK